MKQGRDPFIIWLHGLYLGQPSDRQRWLAWVVELREKKGLTQEELTFKAKMTPGYVGQLELGMRTNPSLDVVRRLARALGVPLRELLG